MKNRNADSPSFRPQPTVVSLQSSDFSFQLFKISWRFFAASSFRFIYSSVFVLFLFVMGCGGKKEILGSSPTFSSLYTSLFSKSCVTCHQPGGSAWADGINLDFSSQPAAYSSLTSLRSTALHCTTLSLVQSGSPTRSVLLAVLFDDYATIAGTSCVGDAIHREQNGNTAAENKSSIVSWIEQGTLNN